VCGIRAGAAIAAEEASSCPAAAIKVSFPRFDCRAGFDQKISSNRFACVAQKGQRQGAHCWMVSAPRVVGALWVSVKRDGGSEDNLHDT
jgi:hypothetical protein